MVLKRKNKIQKTNILPEREKVSSRPGSTWWHQPFDVLPKLLANYPEKITAWVVGTGGPSNVIGTKSKKIDTPILLPGLLVPFIAPLILPAEHLRLAYYLRKAGKKAKIHAIDISKTNLWTTKLVSNIANKTLFLKTKKEEKPTYQYHKIDMDYMHHFPSERPNIISLHYTATFFKNPKKSVEFLLDALAPGGFFITDFAVNALIDEYNLDKKYNLEQVALDVFRKKPEEKSKKEKNQKITT